jgi:RNA polymerase sigma-70 factor (ECF subfamily)
MDFAEHFDRTAPGLVRLCYLATLDREAAADAAQEALARAWRHWDRVSAPGSNPAAWTRTVALNLCRSRWRALARQARLGPQAWTVTARLDDLPDLDLRRALTRLPQRQREAVVLHYWADLDVAACAAAMGVTTGSVKRHLARAGAPRVRAGFACRRLGGGDVVNVTDEQRDDLHDRLDALATAGAQGVELVRPDTVEPGRPWRRSRPALVLAAVAVLAIAGTAVGLTAAGGGGEEVRTGPDSSPVREDASGDASAWEGEVAAVVAVVPGDGLVGTDVAVRFLAPSGDEIARRNLLETAEAGLLEAGLLQAVPEGHQELEVTVHEHGTVFQCTRAFSVNIGEQIIVRVDDLGALSSRETCAGREESVAEWAAGGTGPTGEPYVDLTLARAEERAQDAGLTTRIVGRDGADLVITDDMQTDRLNLMVFAEIVVAARLDTE